MEKRTLLLGLVLLLIGCEEHVVGEGTARDGTLGAHGMRFARQGSGARDAVGGDDTALSLDVHRNYSN